MVNVFGQGYPLLTNLLNKYTGSLEGFWIWGQPLMMEFQENMFGFGIREKTHDALWMSPKGERAHKLAILERVKERVEMGRRRVVVWLSSSSLLRPKNVGGWAPVVSSG